MGCGCGKRAGGAATRTAPLSAGQLFEVVSGAGEIPLRTVDETAAKAKVRKLRADGDERAYHRKAGTTAPLPL
jgi:hypothetical protein